MKKWKLIVIMSIMILACAGCGAQKAETPQTESPQAENETVSFAEEIQTAVSNMDMDALADLCSYPLAVNGEVIEDKDAFLALGGDVIFTEERCKIIASVDVSALEETKAGFIMGDATPNIIFKSVDGKLGITGIN